MQAFANPDRRRRVHKKIANSAAATEPIVIVFTALVCGSKYAYVPNTDFAVPLRASDVATSHACSSGGL